MTSALDSRVHAPNVLSHNPDAIMAVVTALLDIAYSSAHPLLQFDYYCAKGEGDAQPLLVFVHGGAWRS